MHTNSLLVSSTGLFTTFPLSSMYCSVSSLDISLNIFLAGLKADIKPVFFEI